VETLTAFTIVLPLKGFAAVVRVIAAGVKYFRKFYHSFTTFMKVLAAFLKVIRSQDYLLSFRVSLCYFLFSHRRHKGEGCVGAAVEAARTTWAACDNSCLQFWHMC
jgi:hypothetical protein